MRIAWPYVTLKVNGPSGLQIREFTKDAPVPAGADPEDLARLVRKGAVVEDDAPAPAEAPAEPEAEPEAPKKAAAKKTTSA